MTPDVRTPAEEDREQLVDLLRTSLNLTRAWAADRGPTMPLENHRSVYEGDRIIATAAGIGFRQWFGERAIPMSGISAVATLPERRGTGLASAAVLQVLREARDDGVSVSALFPAVVRPYRRLGYEVGGSYCEHRLDLDAIPAHLGDNLPSVELLDVDRDLDGLKACYREWSRHANGPIEPIEDRWWTERTLRPFGEAVFRSVVVRDRDSAIEGFAAFRHAAAEGGHLDVDFGIECSVLATTSDRATRALLAYFRSFRGVGLWVRWCGPPEDPISMLIAEQRIETPYRFRWMTRLLDVRTALAGRGYPAIDAEAVVAVTDPDFPDNDGPWRLTVRHGEPSVETTDRGAGRAVPIGILSSMFTGFLRVPDAVRLGYLDRDDPATRSLMQLFAGADPWCPFFF